MSAKKRLVRISCTVPEDVLAEADSIAAREERSRSWVISEALRRYGGGRIVREPAAPVDQAVVPSGLGWSRQTQLEADVQLTPEQRVRAAEETASLSNLLRPARGTWLVQFDRYEDYLEWKRREAAGG